MSPNYISIGDPRSLGTGASTIPSATEMSRLSRALKRLKGKPKQTKDESAPSMSSATEVATSQPLQSDPKPSLGAPNKTSPTQLLAQGSHGLNSASKVTTSSLQKPASLSGETWQIDPLCELVLQSTKAAPSARNLSRPVSTFTEAALQPKPQPAVIKSPKETPQSEPQRELLDAEEIEDQSIVPKAPEKVAQQPSSSGEAPAVNPQPQPAPKPTVTAPKAKPQPTPKATPQAPKPTLKSVSIPKPAVQTHAGLYSGFTPSVAAEDQPTPKTLSEAQKTALDVLYGVSPSGPSVPKTRRQYTRQDDYNVAQNTTRAAIFGSSTMSSKPSYSAGFSNISYASPSLYSSAGPLGIVRTGGPLGGGQYSSTGGAIGGGTIAQTGGRFGEGSVSKTGGSLGEALGLQGCESRAELEEERSEQVRKLLQDYYSWPRPGFAPETSKAALGYGWGGQAQEHLQMYSASTFT